MVTRWRLTERLLNPDELKMGFPVDPKIGEVWQCPWTIGREGLSDKYKLLHAPHRPPIAIQMPGLWVWLPDFRACRQGQYEGDGWDVIGQIPLITTYPSINAMGIFHGWITNGFISEDTDGRKFDDAGRAIK